MRAPRMEEERPAMQHFHTKVAGVSHYRNVARLRTLFEPVFLVREYDNPHDYNAVAVVAHAGTFSDTLTRPSRQTLPKSCGLALRPRRGLPT